MKPTILELVLLLFIGTLGTIPLGMWIAVYGRAPWIGLAVWITGPALATWAWCDVRFRH